MIEHPFKIECPVHTYTPKSDVQKNERWYFEFSNGWGASVISGEWPYSTEERPYEIAAIKNDNIIYKYDFKDDVIGYLTLDEATELLEKIARYPNES